MEKRYGWLDVMKLLGVYCVYVTHYEETGRFGLFTMSIALGILFFASGFSAAAHEDEAFLPFARQRFLRLMVPYFAFGALTLAMRVAVFELSLGEILDWARRLALGVRNSVPVAALWFLPCLLCMELYYHALRRLLRKRALLLAVCCLLSAGMKLVHEGPALPWGADVAVRFLIYYALGDCAHALLARRGARPLSRAGGVLLGLFLAGNVYVLYTHFYFGQLYFPSLLGLSEVSYPVRSLLQFLYECNGIVCAAAASAVLSALPGLCRAGRCTLVFCCTEQLVKVLVPIALRTVGLTMYETGGPYVLAHAALMLAVSYWAFALPAQRYFPWALGRFQHNNATNHEKEVLTV